MLSVQLLERALETQPIIACAGLNDEYRKPASMGTGRENVPLRSGLGTLAVVRRQVCVSKALVLQ